MWHVAPTIFEIFKVPPEEDLPVNFWNVTDDKCRDIASKHGHITPNEVVEILEEGGVIETDDCFYTSRLEGPNETPIALDISNKEWQLG